MMRNENLLPKNILQNGEIRGRQRICLEDYVMTYIRKTEEKDAGNFLGVFLGERKTAKDMEYVFARGLLEIPDPALAKAEASVSAKKAAQEKKSTAGEPAETAQSGTDSGDKEKWKQDKKIKDSQNQEKTDKAKSSEYTRRPEISEHAGKKVPEEKEQSVEPEKKALTESADSEKTGQRILKKSLRKEASEEAGKTEYSETSENTETTESSEKSCAEPGDPWKRLKREQEMYFPGCQILGCCVIGRYPAGRLEELFKHFPEAKHFLYHLQDQEERLYWLEGEKYQGVQGYFVYYEQNRRMQEYLEESFGEKRVEDEGVGDSAIIRFREKVKGKAEEKSRSFLKLASSFFVVGVLLVGVVAVNRVEDARNADETGSGGSALLESGTQNETDSFLTADGGQNTSDVSGESAGQDAGSTQSSAAAASSNDATGDTGTTAINSEYTLAGADAFWSETTEEGESADADVTGANTGISDTAESDGGVSEACAAGTTISEESVSGTVTSEESTAASEANTTDTAVSQESAAGTVVSEANTTDAAASEESTADTTLTEESASYTAVSDTEEVAVSSTRQIQATYVIREGDTLAAICAKYYGSLDFLEELCEANEISDADLILPGQKIILP
ncbi:MAG: LysM peptidoglycan-binding domain-containing protein [Lachnospiraceae bacterium]|nr:LysM peptidoglycan-binding domain-containing protein [Lachnospiraceae bacterium]